MTEQVQIPTDTRDVDSVPIIAKRGSNQNRLTRQEMQNEAHVIKCLLDTAMAINAAHSQDDMFELIVLAHDRAEGLRDALDQVNAPEGMQ